MKYDEGDGLDFLEGFLEDEYNHMQGSEDSVIVEGTVSDNEEIDNSVEEIDNSEIEVDNSIEEVDNSQIEEEYNDVIDNIVEHDSKRVEVDPVINRNEEESIDEDSLLASLPESVREALLWEPPEPKSTDSYFVNEWIQTGWVGNLHIDKILTEGFITGASDVHIVTGLKVSMTRDGDIYRYDGYPIPNKETMNELIHDGILSYQQQKILNEELEYDGSYTLQYGPMAGRRTRINVGISFGSYFVIFRLINDNIPELSTLGVEDEMVNWSRYPNGLFLLCGPTGSGKSTTLASIVNHLLKTTKKKVITIEKPIEYIYPDVNPSLMVQREVGDDTRGFYEGLTSAMRQAPNVILLGEVRNTEEVTELLRAAETGHLAISTMHTNSVPTTINRIQNLFSGSEQRRIMSTLADTLRGIGNQVLVKNKDGEGRFAVRELLTVNDEVRKLIIEGDVRGIREYQIKRKSTMEHKLAKAVREGKCHIEDALGHSTDLDLFNRLMDENDILNQ